LGRLPGCGRRGNRVLFGVACGDCAVCLVAVATAATLVLAAAVVVVVVRRSAVNAAAACL